MELHGVEIDCTGPVKLPLYERLVAGGALLLVVMVNGRVSNDYCFWILSGWVILLRQRLVVALVLLR